MLVVNFEMFAVFLNGYVLVEVGVLVGVICLTLSVAVFRDTAVMLVELNIVVSIVIAGLVVVD